MVVDDSRTIRDMLAQQLEEFHYKVTAVGSGEEALRALAADAVDVVITDLQMPGAVDGIGLLERIKEEYEHIEVIIITGYASVDTAIEALRKGAVDYFNKPYRLEELLIGLERIAKNKELAAALKYVEKDKEKGIHELRELVTILYRKCLKAEKILRNEKEADRDRIQKALKIVSL